MQLTPPLQSFATVQFAGQSIPLGASHDHPRFQSNNLDEMVSIARRESQGEAGAMVILRSIGSNPVFGAYDIVNLEDGPFHGQPFRFEGRQDLPAIWRWGQQLVAVVDGASWVSPPR